MKKETRGGARPGAGIRKHPTPPTRTIAFRILEDDARLLIDNGLNPAGFYKEAGQKALKKILKKV